MPLCGAMGARGMNPGLPTLICCIIAPLEGLQLSRLNKALNSGPEKGMGRMTQKLLLWTELLSLNKKLYWESGFFLPPVKLAHKHKARRNFGS